MKLIEKMLELFSTAEFPEIDENLSSKLAVMKPLDEKYIINENIFNCRISTQGRGGKRKVAVTTPVIIMGRDYECTIELSDIYMSHRKSIRGRTSINSMDKFINIYVSYNDVNVISMVGESIEYDFDIAKSVQSFIVEQLSQYQKKHMESMIYGYHETINEVINDNMEHSVIIALLLALNSEITITNNEEEINNAK